jgi:hypothetical protein
MQIAFVPVLMIAGFMVFAGLALWLAAKASAQTRENVRGLAGRLGLTLEPVQPVLGFFYPSPQASGRIRGKAVRLYTYTTGSGKSRHTWSAVAATPAVDGGLTFALSRQGFGTKLLELFGAKEITVGNAAFDGAWFVQTNEPDYFRAALLPELQEKFRPLQGACKLEKGVVTYVEQGAFAGEERCQRFARAAEIVCDLADIAEVYAGYRGR